MNEDKKKIKGMVKESLAGLFEKSKKSKKSKEKKQPKSKVDAEEKTDLDKDSESGDKPLDQQDQTSIKNALDKDKNPLAPAISQVMHKVTGASPDDASARSEFLKKVKQTHGLGLTQDEKASTEVQLGLK